MKHVLVLLGGTLAALLAGPAAPAARAATIHVPADEKSIQGAVLAGSPGDTVLVAPGRYRELIQMRNGIVLRAAAGPDSTFLLSPGLGEKVVDERLLEIPEGCDRSTVIEGFTFDPDDLGGCAIYVDHAQPTIRGNRFPPAWGWGVHLHFSDARIEDNVFDGCNTFAILARASSPEIFRNEIKNCIPQAINIAGKQSHPVIGGSPENSNRIYANQLHIVNESRNDIDATFNDWGWDTGSEMDRKGYPQDIVSITDGNDRAKSARGRGKVDYRNWVSPAESVRNSSAGSGRSPLVPALVGVGLVGAFVLVSRMRRAPSR